MGLLESLQGALSGPVRGLVQSFGHRVDVRRETSQDSTTESGRELLQWGTPTGYTSVPCIIEEISGEHARYRWGNETKVTARGTVSTVDYSPRLEDGLIVTKGPFTTRRFIVRGKRATPEAGMVELGLEETEDTFADP